MSKTNKNRTNVAVLVRGFPNIVQTYIINHITSLINAGCRVTIIAVFNPQQKETHPAVEKYQMLDDTIYINTNKIGTLSQIISLPVFNSQYLSAVFSILHSRLWKKYGFIYSIKAVFKAKALADNTFDIAHSHAMFSSYEYLFLKEVFAIPLVTTFHGLEPKNAKSLPHHKIKQILTSCDAFFLNTTFAKKQLIDLGCPEKKIHIIPQATNVEDFPYSDRKIGKDNPVVILSVGRLSIEKGFHITVNAIAKLVKKHPSIQYRIIGSGTEEANLRQQIDGLELSNNVTIFGAVSTEILQKQYTHAHIFILPSIDFRDGSHTETQGVVLQEAQASGIPVIASRTGGIPEIIKDGQTGLLFEEGDSQQLSEKIDSLINDRSLYSSLQKQGRKDVEENYSVEAISKRLTSIYEKILTTTSS